MAVENMKLTKGMTPYRIACSEIWGGICDVDVDACTSALTASIYSHSCRGGKGGDIYYLSVCDTDRLTRVAIADVVGHGQVVSEMGQWVYEALATRMNDPAGDSLLEDLNHRIISRGLEAMTTAAILSFYRDDSNLYVSYAGHPPLLMRRRGESRWHIAGSERPAAEPNLPLGVQDPVPYAQDHFPVGPGDRLLAYTDGLTDAADEQGDLFGLARLVQALADGGDAALPDLKRLVLEAVRHHTGGPLEHDDVTLLAMEIR